MEVTTSTKTTFRESLAKNRLIVILSVAVLVLLVILVIGLATRSKNNTPKADANFTTQPQPQVNTGYPEFLPAQTCPDELIFENNNLSAKLNGKTYMLRGEDQQWVDANCETSNSNTQATKGIKNYTSFECVGSGSVNYTSEIIKLNDLGQIVPLGRMFDSHVTPTDHQYWQPKSMTASWNEYNLYAPADGYIVGIGRSLPGEVKTIDMAYTSTETEYRIVIEHTCDFSTIFIHVHGLSDKILNQVTFDENNRVVGMPRIQVSAGEVIGTVGGSTLDVTTVDATKKLPGFANEATYEMGEPWKIYTADTIAYYSEPLKSQYYNKVSRSIEPISGKIDYDKAGFLSGNWYREGSGGFSSNSSERYWDGHLAIAYDVHNPNYIIVSTGHFLDGKSDQFMVDPNSPDPSSVNSSSGIVIYNLYDYFYTHSDGSRWDITTVGKDLVLEKNGEIKGKILLQVQADNNLKVEIVGPNSNQTSFSGAAQIYTR